MEQTVIIVSQGLVQLVGQVQCSDSLTKLTKTDHSTSGFGSLPKKFIQRRHEEATTHRRLNCTTHYTRAFNSKITH